MVINNDDDNAINNNDDNDVTVNDNNQYIKMIIFIIATQNNNVRNKAITMVS